MSETLNCTKQLLWHSLFSLIPHIYIHVNRETFAAAPQLKQNTHVHVLQYFRALPEYSKMARSDASSFITGADSLKF